MTEPKHDNRLARAYGRMMERVKLLLEELDVSASIEHAAEKAVELDELTREEARLIGGYLKRDIEDASQYLTSGCQPVSNLYRPRSAGLDAIRSETDRGPAAGLFSEWRGSVTLGAVGVRGASRRGGDGGISQRRGYRARNLAVWRMRQIGRFSRSSVHRTLPSLPGNDFRARDREVWTRT